MLTKATAKVRRAKAKKSRLVFCGFGFLALSCVEDDEEDDDDGCDDDFLELVLVVGSIL